MHKRKICAKFELINGLPYIDNIETLTIYCTICNIINLFHSKQEVEYNSRLNNTRRLAKYYSQNTTAGNVNNPLLKMRSLYQSIFKYYISCYPDMESFYVHPIFYNQNLYTIVDKNLLFWDNARSLAYLLTDKNVMELLKQQNLIIPTNKRILRNLFSALKALISNESEKIYDTTIQRSLSFTSETNYFFYITYEDQKLLLYKTATQLAGPLITINTTINAHISEAFKNYISELVCHDIHSLRTLAKIAAALHTPHQPFKKLIITENTAYAKMNLEVFFNSCVKCGVQNNIRLSNFCTKKNLLLKFYSQPFSHSMPLIYFMNDTKINKLTLEKQSILRKLINGSTIYLDDSIFTKLYYHNYVPIIFFSRNENDYSFLEKHFSCTYLKIAPDSLTIPTLTENDMEWINRIFIPWGRELLFNSNLDITKKAMQKQTLPSTSIEEFMTTFTYIKESSICYPEDLYASYKRFAEHSRTNCQICTKGAFIKLLTKSKKYTYARKHIRASKKHPASNRYAFKNLAIDTEKLDVYLQGNPIPTTAAENKISTLENELELITKHYQNFFDNAICLDKNSDLQAQINRPLKPYETLQKATGTIESSNFPIDVTIDVKPHKR